MGHELFIAQQVDLLVQILSSYITQPVRMLDFGCGDGLMTYYVQRAFTQAHIVGVDTNAQLIDQALSDYQTIDFRQVNECKLPFDNNSFDIIYAAQVFHHIPKHDQLRMLIELKRIIKKGGIMIILELNPWNYKTRRAFNQNPAERDANIMSCWRAWSLMKAIQMKQIDWYQIPFGSFYAISAIKD